MPNRTVYIRPDNVDTWNSLENKSEWLNDLLGAKEVVATIDRLPHIKTAPTADAVKKVWPGIGPVITEKNKDTKFCKHGFAQGFCKKGCK